MNKEKEIDYRVVYHIFKLYHNMELNYNNANYFIQYYTDCAGHSKDDIYHNSNKTSLRLKIIDDKFKYTHSKSIIYLDEIYTSNENEIVKLINEAIIYRLNNYDINYEYYELRNLTYNKDKIKLKLEVDFNQEYKGVGYNE